MKELDKIVQFYIVDSRNIIGKPIVDENGIIIGGFEIVNNKKAIPMSWSYLFYDKIPDELLITDNKQGLLAFFVNFNQKVLMIGNKDILPIVNYEDILIHWEDLKKDGYDLKNPALNREEHSVLLKRVKNGWKFSFATMSGGMSIIDFIKNYVSLEKFNISEIQIELKEPITDKLVDEFFINNEKINMWDYIMYNTHYNFKKIFENKNIYNDVVTLELIPNYIFYKGCAGIEDNYVNKINFRMISELNNTLL